MSFNLIPGRAYYMGVTEVTQRQYTSVMGSNPSEYGEERYDHPVETVSFSDAQRFCARLNARPVEVRAGRTYRIPLEEEWNHAGRAGATTVYYFGDNVADLGDYAWYSGSAGLSHVSVATKLPNAWGLYDIHGNVYEWCFADPPSPGSQRILGGGWYSDADACEFGTTIYADETDKASIIGFRVIMELEPAKAVGECEYIITLDGEEVYRATCYEGASCRDPSGSVGVLIGYDEGTLTWTKHEPRPLAVTTDPDTGCNDFFCGTCRCSCRTLCVDVFEVLFSYDTPFATDTYSGTLTDTAYSDCDPPVWEGTIGNFEIRLALGRDSYGNCIITATVDGEESTVSVTGCEDLSGTVEMYDGSYFNFRCNDCNNCATVVGDCICGRPLGQTLTLLWSSGNGTHGDAPREFPLSYGLTSAEGIVCAPYPTGGPFPAYTGSASGAFPIPMGGTRGDTLYVMMVCCIGCPTCVYYRYASNIAVGDLTWYLTYITTQDCSCPAILEIGDFQTAIDYQISDITIFEEASNC
jgi:hypothetical protein